jgi:hypothetical protein
MALTVEQPKLSLDRVLDLQKELHDNGYLSEYYVNPRKTTRTLVCCPICGKHLIVDQYAASYLITCETENCIQISVRGI